MEGCSSANKKINKTPKKNKLLPPQSPLPPTPKVNITGALYAVPVSRAFPADPPPKKVEITEVHAVDDDQMIDAEPLSQIPPPPPPQTKTKNRISKPNEHVKRESRFFDGPFVGLPKGWMVETRKRIPTMIDNVLGRESKIRVDQFYYEPETHKQFRSRAAVDAYLRQQSTTLEEGSSSSADGGNGH